MKRCGQEGLGINGAKSKFFKTNSGSERDMLYFQKRFWCLDFDKIAEEAKQAKEEGKIDLYERPESGKIEIQGSYHSTKARHLKLNFLKCDPKKRSTCHSDEEISSWMRRKFLLVLENTARFEINQFGTDDDENLPPRII